MANTSIIKEIRANSKKNHANNGLISYVLFFFAAVLAAGLVLINLLVPALFLLVGPLLIIPILFSAQIATNIMRNENVMTFKDFLTCFGIYFTEHFRSSFRVIRSALFGLAVFGVLSLTSSVVCSATFYNADFLGTKIFVDTLQNSNIYDYEVLQSIYTDYYFLIHTYLICTLYTSNTGFILVFTYFASKYSFMLPVRIDDMKYTGRMISAISENVLKNYRKQFLQVYWGINFPMVILFLGGFALGSYIGTLYSFDYNAMFTFGLAVAILLSFGFYGPKYFANKEAIADYFMPMYRAEQTKLTKNISNKIEDMLKSFNNKDENTKKDSEES